MYVFVGDGCVETKRELDFCARGHAAGQTFRQMVSSVRSMSGFFYVRICTLERIKWLKRVSLGRDEYVETKRELDFCARGHAAGQTFRQMVSSVRSMSGFFMLKSVHWNVN